jgi:hypothetical protein
MRSTWSWAALAALGLALAARADGPKAAPKEGPKEGVVAKPAAKSYEVPYRLTVPKHVLVRAKINGKGPYNFILDTGAPALFVAVPVCKKVGVKADGTGWGTFDRFEIEGGVVLTKVRGRVETPFQLEGMNGMGLAGVEVHGLIGYNVLARYRMTIDFTRDKMTWVPLDYKPKVPAGMGRKGGGQGGLEVMGGVMKALGGLLGKKPEPDLAFRPFLGVTLADGDDHPVVKAVLARGPAGLGGVQAGDTLTRIEGRGVYNAHDVETFLGKNARPGQTVRLTVLRGKETKVLRVRLGEGL